MLIQFSTTMNTPCTTLYQPFSTPYLLPTTTSSLHLHLDTTAPTYPPQGNITMRHEDGIEVFARAFNSKRKHGGHRERPEPLSDNHEGRRQRCSVEYRKTGIEITLELLSTFELHDATVLHLGCCPTGPAQNEMMYLLLHPSQVDKGGLTTQSMLPAPKAFLPTPKNNKREGMTRRYLRQLFEALTCRCSTIRSRCAHGRRVREDHGSRQHRDFGAARAC